MMEQPNNTKKFTQLTETTSTEKPARGSKMQENAIELGSLGLLKMRSFAEDFRSFVRNGNVVDLAIGLMLGASFQAIVTSLVKDIVTPLFGFFSEKNLENSFLIVRCPAALPSCTSSSWNTPTLAHKAGAVTLNWGSFVQAVLNFFLNALFMFIIIKKVFGIIFREEFYARKKCHFCKEFIKASAIRCRYCGSNLENEQSPE